MLLLPKWICLKKGGILNKVGGGEDKSVFFFFPLTRKSCLPRNRMFLSGGFGNIIFGATRVSKNASEADELSWLQIRWPVAQTY